RGPVWRALSPQGHLPAARAAGLPSQGAPAIQPAEHRRGASRLEKGGLADALTDAGVTTAAGLAWADEMRLGLRGLVRRVWAPRGVKVRQAQVLTYVWRYLALAVNGLTGTLEWTWTTSMKKEAIATVVSEWHGAGLRAVVW